MSTVRFSKVLDACGKPDIHLLLIDPAKDKTLQAAIKSDRVMTLYQESGSTDHGIVGFEPGRSRQFLVFPKPLKSFQDQRVVGIKYELLEDAPVSKKELAKTEPVKSGDEERSKTVPTKKNAEASKRPDQVTPTVLPKSGPDKHKPAVAVEEGNGNQSSTVSEDKVVKFQKPEPANQPQAATESDELKELKRLVRQAMDALEEGKQVAAFNLLKQIVDPAPSSRIHHHR